MKPIKNLTAEDIGKEVLFRIAPLYRWPTKYATSKISIVLSSGDILVSFAGFPFYLVTKSEIIEIGEKKRFSIFRLPELLLCRKRT